MKILYKQAASPKTGGDAPLFSLGVRQLYLKELSLAQDGRHITKKRHHHQNFEIHILTEGSQTYAAEAGEYTLLPGQLFVIPPLVSHRVVFSAPKTRKYSICFRLESGSPLSMALPPEACCLHGACPPALFRQFDAIRTELEQKPPFYQWSVSSRLTDLVLCLLRLIGLRDGEPVPEKTDEEPRLLLAKQFIHDNIEFAPSVSEAAAYCHLSCRQLTRIFLQAEQCTPAAYIRAIRFRKTEALLLHTDLSLQQISEQMHFSTAYYFNTFFKQHAGMTPSEYRKMHRHNG